MPGSLIGVARVVIGPGALSGLGNLVVWLSPARECVRQVDSMPEQGQFLDHAATSGAYQGRKGSRMDPEFLVAVQVEVHFFAGQVLSSPKTAFGFGQPRPDRIPEVPEVKAAETPRASRHRCIGLLRWPGGPPSVRPGPGRGRKGPWPFCACGSIRSTSQGSSSSGTP